VIVVRPQPKPSGVRRSGNPCLLVAKRPVRCLGTAKKNLTATNSRIGHPPIFSSLLLWQDISHDGESSPSELHTLASLGVRAIELNYAESKRQDQYGNQFRYRAGINLIRGRRDLSCGCFGGRDHQLTWALVFRNVVLAALAATIWFNPNSISGPKPISLDGLASVLAAGALVASWWLWGVISTIWRPHPPNGGQ